MSAFPEGLQGLSKPATMSQAGPRVNSSTCAGSGVAAKSRLDRLFRAMLYCSTCEGAPGYADVHLSPATPRPVDAWHVGIGAKT